MPTSRSSGSSFKEEETTFKKAGEKELSPRDLNKGKKVKGMFMVLKRIEQILLVAQVSRKENIWKTQEIRERLDPELHLLRVVKSGTIWYKTPTDIQLLSTVQLQDNIQFLKTEGRRIHPLTFVSQRIKTCLTDDYFHSTLGSLISHLNGKFPERRKQMNSMRCRNKIRSW